MEKMERLNSGVKGLDDKMQGGFVKGSVSLITGKTGTGKCITADTPIILSSGEIKTAKDIFDNFHTGNENEIWIQPDNLELPSLNPKTMKIESKKVKFLYRQKITENIIKIRTTSGREIEVTKVHPCVSLKNGKIIYKKSSEVKKGDFVAIPRRIKIGLVNDGGMPTMDMSSLTKFLALQIAEGDEWTKKSYYLRFSNKNEGMLKFYSDLSKELFDYEPKRYDQKDKTPALCIFSKEIIERLKSIGFEPRLFSRNKKIPDFIMKLPDEIVAEFLRTLFDCEASVSKKNSSIELSTSSYDIANKTAFLLLRFGIVGRIRKKRKYATNTQDKIKRSCFEIVISGGEQLRKFYENINFDIEYKKKNLEFCIRKNPGSNVDVIPDMGGLLREIREMLNIPATKMKEIGCKQAIYMYEWGKRNPTAKMLNKFISVFRKRLSSLNTKDVANKIRNLEMLASSDIF